MIQLVTRKEGIERIRHILAGIRVAMLTTVGLNGELHSQPVVAQHNNFDGDVWFFVDHASTMIDEIRYNERVNAGFMGQNGYVSLAGRARIVDEIAKKRELWQESLRMWFEGGPESADLALIRFETASGQFWEGQAGGTLGKMVNIVRMFMLRDESALGDITHSEPALGESG